MPPPDDIRAGALPHDPPCPYCGCAFHHWLDCTDCGCSRHDRPGDT